MEAGGRCGNRSFLFSVNRLVAVAIRLVGFPFHVVREGEMPVLVEIGRRVPLDEPLALRIDLYDGACTKPHFHGAPFLHFFSGPDEAPPVGGIGSVGADDFDRPIVGKEAGRDDFRVVEDEEVIGWEEVGKVRELVMRNLARGPVDDHHARGRAIIERARSDEFLREVVMKVGKLHRNLEW